MARQLQANRKNYQAAMEATTPYVIFCGGTGSGKTYALLQSIITRMIQSPDKGLLIQVYRRFAHSHKNACRRDFRKILEDMEIFDQKNVEGGINFTAYNLCGNKIQFSGIDQAFKSRGPRADIAFFNECSEITYEQFFQCAARTKGTIYMDFNPSESFGWYWDLIEKEPEKVTYVHSTYLDNRFISDNERTFIESITDPEFRLIYKDGLKGGSRSLVYTHWKLYDEVEFACDDFCYGVDVGFTHPLALVKVSFKDNKILAEELIYEKGLTTDDLITMMNELNISKTVSIFCDSAAPIVIETLCRAGYQAKGSDKSVTAGIDFIRSRELLVRSSSTNLIKELKSYKYKLDRDGHALEDVVKLMDDSCDAMRYAVFSGSPQRLYRPNWDIPPVYFQ